MVTAPSRKPAELAALDANLKVLGMANRIIFDGLGAAAVNGVVDLNYMKMLSHDRQETRIAAVLERVELRSLTFSAPDQALRFLLIGDGQELAIAIDYALVAHGAYQDPQTIDLLSKLRRSAFVWSCENEPRIGLWPAYRDEAAWNELITLINALDSDLRQRCRALGRTVPKAPLEGQFLTLTQEALYGEAMRRKAATFRATQPLAAAPKP